MRAALAVLLVAAATSAARADDLELHPQDSITIDGTRYTCADPSRRGVQLAPGDRVTAGRHHLRCVGDDGGGYPPPPPPPPPPPRELAVSSSVDPACIDGLYQAVSGKPEARDAVGWAEACRTFELSRRCGPVGTRPDDGCVAKLNQVISGSFTDADIPAVQRACERREAACPSLPSAATSAVDVGCLDRLYRTTAGKPTGRSVLGWIASCRDRAPGSCVAVGGAYNSACVNAAYQMISGRFTAAEGAEAARACRTLQLRCE